MGRRYGRPSTQSIFIRKSEQAVMGSMEPTFPFVRDALLERAGGGWSLSDAAKEMGIREVEMLDLIRAGAVLGVMRDDEVLLPKLQFAAAMADNRVVLPGIDRIASLFRDTKAGAWSALQFLIDKDPNLARRPIDALRNGDIDAVEQAARAYLQVDEAEDLSGA